jgi:hypothetical protein
MTTTRKPETAKCDECWDVTDTFIRTDPKIGSPRTLCVHCHHNEQRNEW